jgi:hypothetical protein
MSEIQNKILDRAFAGEWITLAEVRVFGEESDKESGNETKDDKGFARMGNAITGGAVGAGLLGTVGGMKYGTKGAVLGGLAGATIGALGGAQRRKYRAVFLDEEKKIMHKVYSAYLKYQVLLLVKMDYLNSSCIKVFECPEEEEKAGEYINKLYEESK